MRWTPKSKEILRRGAKRERIKFAWFPTKVKTTWVWLEKYRAIETVDENHTGKLYWTELVSATWKDGKIYPDRDFYV